MQQTFGAALGMTSRRCVMALHTHTKNEFVPFRVSWYYFRVDICNESVLLC
jgi:hypothetical protein